MTIFNRLIFVLFIFVIFLNNGSLSAIEKKRIAVLELDAKNAPKAYADIARDRLEINLHNTNTFIVLERGMINLILKEQGLQMSGCTDTSCAVQIGKLLSADLIVVGSLSKIKIYTLSIKMVDVGKGNIIVAETGNAATEDDIEAAVKLIANRLSEKISHGKEKITATPVLPKEKKEEKVSEVPAGYYLRGIVPGWGQWYADRPFKGIGYFTLFAASGVLFYYGHTKYLKAKDDYDNLNASNSSAEYKDKRDTYKTAATRVKIFLGIFAASYVVNWIDILFFSKPDFNTKAEAINSGVFSDFKIVNGCETVCNKPETRLDLIIGIRF